MSPSSGRGGGDAHLKPRAAYFRAPRLACPSCWAGLRPGPSCDEATPRCSLRGAGGRAMAGYCSVLRAFLFEYDTPRIVLIRSRKVGLMNRLVQLLILAYVIG